MKLIGWSVSIFIFTCVVFSCAENTPDTSDATLQIQIDSIPGINLDTILKRGKLIAITNNSPTSYFIYRGRPMGYQYDLLQDFAKSIGVELEIKIVSSIPDAIDSLHNRKADILASGLTVLGDRKKDLDFTIPIVQTHQILIQRKPDNYRKLNKTQIEKLLLRDVTTLAGKTVYVEEGSSYYDRLIHLQEEIGDSIHIVPYTGKVDMDSLMSMVSNGEIEYAICEEYTAKFFHRYYANLDIQTPISLNQNIAWAIPKNSQSLMDTINYWIAKNKNTTRWAVVYNKYFKYNHKMNERVESDYTMSNGKISPYDKIIKNEAAKINWDWKLVAAQVSVESGFKTNRRSWAGAEGLMQIMPATAKSLNPHHTNIHDPRQNIAMGVKFDGILFNYWTQSIPDSIQAVKFSLASYNIGKGHVYDAQRLAEKYDLDPNIWDDNVALMIKKLSKSDYYRDPVVRYGYCRGMEAYNYVNRIFTLYQNYQNFDTVDT